MNWTQIGRFLRTAFLLRVPLITLLLLAVLGPVSLTSGEKLLGNLFDERVVRFNNLGVPEVWRAWSTWHLFTVSFAAFLAGFTGTAVINLVLHYGKDRFEDPSLDLAQKRPLLTFLCGIASALPLVICAALHTPMPDYVPWLATTAGFVCALALVFVAKVVQLVFTDPTTTPHPPPYLVFPVYLIPVFERFFDSLYCLRWSPLSGSKEFINRKSQWLLEILRCAGQGYLVDCEAPPGKLVLRSGHVFALALSLLATAAYLGIGYAKGRIDDKPATVPALTFVLLFGIVLCWGLGALAFFLDRFRVPLLAGIAALSLTTSFSPQSDHIYRVEPLAHRLALMQPSEVVASHISQGNKRVILVASAGGGIQAAAWTVRVLRGLEEECERYHSGTAGTADSARCDFRKSVVLVSGVSGGSLGAMAYARSFTDSPVPIDRRVVPANAAASALDEVAWGWTNPDVGRSVLPWFRRQYIDRGWALEERWSAINQLRNRKTGKDSLLGEWADSVRGGMPALMLNATLVEKGQPVVFSTSAFPKPNDLRGLQNFFDLYPGSDIRVNTAARLSASFPYVAPAARSDAAPSTVSDDHVVDGGYYDNYGMTALLGWLESVLETPAPSENHPDLTDVLILQIRPFPTGEPTARSERGWGYQLIAPIDGLMDVRDTGQATHDQTELSLFTQSYRNKGIHVWRADFVYPATFAGKDKDCAHAPLSWKLSLEQTNCILRAWIQLRNGGPNGSDEVNCVMHYLQNEPVVHRDPLKQPSQTEGTAVCRAGDDGWGA